MFTTKPNNKNDKFPIQSKNTLAVSYIEPVETLDFDTYQKQ